MMFFLMTISLVMSMFLIVFKHPLSMGLTLLIQTIVVSLSVGFFSMSYWYSYILFLVMVGGMLVLFIYMTSVASNEMFLYSYKIMIMFWILIISMMIIYLKMDNFLIYINNTNLESSNFLLTYSMNLNLSMNKYLMFPTNFINYMIIIYLLITLIAVVKITDIKQGPLRQMN
uniref:NADH-ubiquinone oxidoreductase chain 6 n=2 Tax=Aphodius foetens TaxID=207149 RepID=A0A7L7S750_9SCAR|nr:NADH dehydrogenase subunit 6 [Aphodius foetens]